MSSLRHTEILSAMELEQVSGGYTDWEVDWCGTGPKRIPIKYDPSPQPWQLAGGWINLVALNPQPLPPKEIGLNMAFSF